GKMADLHPTSAFVHKIVSAKELADSLARIAYWVIENGIDAPGRYRAGRDLLVRHLPRRKTETRILYDVNHNIVDEARKLVLQLNNGVLPIQGPPGSGKTYTAARMICELLRAGRKVGVTAVSHKVIRKLMQEVLKAAAVEQMPVACIEKVT